MELWRSDKPPSTQSTEHCLRSVREEGIFNQIASAWQSDCDEPYK
jgi:hypothetical protein